MINLPCNCTTSPFTDPNHGHIVSGDIRIVQNNKLRKLLCKGPKYKEPVSINLSNCKTEIKNSLTKFSSDWCNKKGVPVKCFTHWISIVMEKVNNKIKKLKSKIKFSKVKQVLRDPEVISYLNVLQEQYIMCPIDKAANNIAFICKKYYVQVLLKELGLLNATSSTYQQGNDTLHNILRQQNNTPDPVFGLKNNDKKFYCLPCIYWLPKMDKIPSGARLTVTGIAMGSDPAPFFANLFLAHKEADWVKAQRKLGKTNVRKINSPFRFIDDLLSLNDSSGFEKHYKDIYPIELELKKESNNNSYASFLDFYIYIENGEFHTRLFNKRDEFGFNIVRMPFYCSNVLSKMFYGSIGAEFFRISRATSKIEDLSCNRKQLLSRMLK